MDRRPQAGGPYLIPISKNLYSIPRYVRARPTVYTLLSIQLDPNERILNKKVALKGQKTPRIFQYIRYFVSKISYLTCGWPRIGKYIGGRHAPLAHN